MADQPALRLQRARIALDGLSVGDALGERFFRPGAMALLDARALPNPEWRYTDDTNMALSIFENLRLYGEIRQDELAKSFARHYNPFRGYGAAMHGLLIRIQEDEAWRTAAGSLFDGQGSFGNGAAMRIAPLGAYFADDLDKVVEQARLAAEVTHAHPEGIAGAIAVALAAAYAHRLGQERKRLNSREFIDLLFDRVPSSFVHEALRLARNLSPNSSVVLAASAVGNGSRISAQDTVPFAVWAAGRFLDDYPEAIWQTISIGGDIDTNCAMVGGIVACYTGHDGIPPEWIQHREPLPAWALGEGES